MSSFFSVVAGPKLESLTLKLNSFTGIFFKVFKSKGRTEILQISFLERIYFGIYVGVAKRLKNYVTRECVQRVQKIFFKNI